MRVLINRNEEIPKIKKIVKNEPYLDKYKIQRDSGRNRKLSTFITIKLNCNSNHERQNQKLNRQKHDSDNFTGL